ncbi:hypothetical protein P4S72_13965 [Vibrio sp. PP-XX7]
MVSASEEKFQAIRNLLDQAGESVREVARKIDEKRDGGESERLRTSRDEWSSLSRLSWRYSLVTMSP